VDKRALGKETPLVDIFTRRLKGRPSPTKKKSTKKLASEEFGGVVSSQGKVPKSKKRKKSPFLGEKPLYNEERAIGIRVH